MTPEVTAAGLAKLLDGKAFDTGEEFVEVATATAKGAEIELLLIDADENERTVVLRVEQS